MSEQPRASFGGKLSVILVAAGSAIGLGALWRFPYIAGKHGGAAFLLVFVFAIGSYSPLVGTEPAGNALHHELIVVFRREPVAFVGNRVGLAHFEIKPPGLIGVENRGSWIDFRELGPTCPASFHCI